MKSLSFDTTNALCGALFIGLGGFFIYQSLGLELGTAFKMGPGYFPLFLAAILALLGVIIIVQSTRLEGEPLGHVRLHRGALGCRLLAAGGHESSS